jgi:hypothetical protein
MAGFILKQGAAMHKEDVLHGSKLLRFNMATPHSRKSISCSQFGLLVRDLHVKAREKGSSPLQRKDR